MVFEKSKLLKWMLARLRPREFDSNKQYTAEVLAIFLQNSSKNQQRLADANGIDALLQVPPPTPSAYRSGLQCYVYRKTSISETKKAQTTFPLRHFFPLKVVKKHGKVKSNSMENCPA
jgi:hypothetical protein